jgi:ADP-ribose pyrophosphatase YjhB (NUDIX family)
MAAILKGALQIAYEAARLILRRPVFGVMAVALDERGQLVLMRRADRLGWGLPGGVAEWGEVVEATLRREVTEETGYEVTKVGRLIGVYSDPARDPRFHAIVVAIAAEVTPRGKAANPLETREVRAFPLDALPQELAFDARRIVDDYRRGEPVIA